MERNETSGVGQIGVVALGGSIVVAAIFVTSIGDTSALGAPSYWAWLLTGLQVVALRTAANGNPFGWLIGASVQLPWIAYALITAQVGFVPGCLISGLVQAHGYLRQRASRSHFEELTYA